MLTEFVKKNDGSYNAGKIKDQMCIFMIKRPPAPVQ